MRATVIFLLFASFALGDEYHPRLKKSVKKSQEILDNEDINYWVDKGKNEIERAKNLRNNIIEKRAKNVIIFVGDGMSLPTLTAARIYKAQKADRFKENTNAEGGLLYFEGFPHVGLSKVFYSLESSDLDRFPPQNAGNFCTQQVEQKRLSMLLCFRPSMLFRQHRAYVIMLIDSLMVLKIGFLHFLLAGSGSGMKPGSKHCGVALRIELDEHTPCLSLIL